MPIPSFTQEGLYQWIKDVKTALLSGWGRRVATLPRCRGMFSFRRTSLTEGAARLKEEMTTEEKVEWWSSRGTTGFRTLEEKITETKVRTIFIPEDPLPPPPPPPSPLYPPTQGLLLDLSP